MTVTTTYRNCVGDSNNDNTTNNSRSSLHDESHLMFIRYG